MASLARNRRRCATNQTYYVYAMFDPRDYRARYIGVSNNPEKRVRSHVRRAHTSELREWINGLLVDGVQPEYRILDSTVGQLYGHWAEKWWIGMYSFVCPGQLLNRLWTSQFVYRYKLELSASSLRNRQEQEKIARRWRDVQLARAKARRMLRNGRRDVKEMAAELGVANSIVWDELRAIDRRRDVFTEYRVRLSALLPTG